MTYYSIMHWLFIERSKKRTIFEGSPKSKMSQIILDKDIRDVLIAKRRLCYFNLMKVASVVRREDLIKQRLGANLRNFLVYEIEFSKTYRFESDV